ncbi:uncharacterized protein LOC127857650 isoform X2 [Dreissena polymorpha]|uniref:uncharacterized protein LOC127857650 isoform X2 n=1 Tax=Dreissena polymorpha TaxID=45954 RepID=UPI002264B95F|nr:uncharacterized protein LOC127857650 isoform X2 [Dreissena polymorpha]
MAAACSIGEGDNANVAREGEKVVDSELLEAQIVAQAITELQEIQAPITSQVIESEQLSRFLSSIAASGEATHIDGDNQTQQIIYYIEDNTGTLTRNEARVYVDTSVQANDYEIERRSGRLPARRRFIPAKFRDYKNTSDPETSDSDFDPHEYLARPKRPRTQKLPVTKSGEHEDVLENGSLETTKEFKHVNTRKVGRPSKKAMITEQENAVYLQPDPELETILEMKYQQALREAREDADRRRAQGPEGGGNGGLGGGNKEQEGENVGLVRGNKEQERENKGQRGKNGGLGRGNKGQRGENGGLGWVNKKQEGANEGQDSEEEGNGGDSSDRGANESQGLNKLNNQGQAQTKGENEDRRQEKGKVKGHNLKREEFEGHEQKGEGSREMGRKSGKTGGQEIKAPTNEGQKSPQHKMDSMEDAQEQQTDNDERDPSEETDVKVDVNKSAGKHSGGEVITPRSQKLLELGLNPEEEVTPIKRGRGRPRGPDWGADFKCPDCDKVFKVKGNLRMHLKTHLNVKMFACTLDNCGKSFSSNESLRRHQLVHKGIKPFQCDICERCFSSNVALIEHRTLHFDEKMHQCPHCVRRFRHVSSFRRHLLTHTTALPYRCTACGRQFQQTSYLRSHMKIHTGEKPYQCVQCGKRFAHQSDVKRHQTTHTGEKPYKCSKCNARFSDVSSKSRHEKEHENNKRFTCSYCNDTFKRAGQLRSHLLRKHRDPNATEFMLKVDNLRDFKSVEFGPGLIQIGDQSNISQQRIVSIINNLNKKTGSSTQGYIEVDSVFQLSGNQSETESGHVTSIDQSEREGEVNVIEVPIELQGVEIPDSGNGHTYIAVSHSSGMDIAHHLGVAPETAYRVIYEVDENGDQRQLLVPCSEGMTEEGETIKLGYITSHLSTTEELETTGATDVIVDSMETTDSNHSLENTFENGEGNTIDCTTVTTETHYQQVTMPDSNYGAPEDAQGVDDQTSNPGQAGVMDANLDNQFQEQTNDLTNLQETDHECNVDSDNENSTFDGQVNPHSRDRSEDMTVAEGIKFISDPDFTDRDYYHWLKNFTKWCKVMPLPLETSLFQKISQVHKTLSDVMASPRGIVAERDKFCLLMGITQELGAIINEHLMFIMQNLDS